MMRHLYCLIPAAFLLSACTDIEEPLAPGDDFAPAVSEILLWTFVKIDMLDMGEGVATAINDAGVATGVYEGPNGAEVFTWTKAGGMQFPGVAGIAYDINNSGDIVGRSGAHGFLRWSYGAMSDLGTLAAGDSSTAFALNEDRQVVGASDAPVESHAFRWSHPGPMEDIHDFYNSGHLYSSARGINASGAIVGWGYQTFDWDAFMWTPTHGLTLLPGYGGADTRAYDINDAGIVVDRTQETYQDLPIGDYYAVKWTPAGITALSGPGDYETAAYSINNNHYVVGVTEDSGPTLWAPSGAQYALGDLPGANPWAPATAQDLNLHLEIVGHAWVNGVQHAVYWKVTFYHQAIGRFIPILKPELPPYIELGRTGPLEFAVLSDARFDASRLDASRFTLGDFRGDDVPVVLDAKRQPSSARVDVDDDGDIDLVLRFDQATLERSGELTGRTTQLVVSADLGEGKGIHVPVAVTVVVR